ncbi:MAG: transglycosylase SLT domain-containing protein [Patescibacteria group bacterium]|nr:transglycosylase SLT domain-containing protein [Patescibacteria group bacterium]
MTPTPGPADLPLHVDSSDVDALYQKLVDADSVVQQLQADLTKAVGAASGVHFGSFTQMQGSLLAGGSGGAAGMGGVDKAIDAILAKLDARITQLVQHAQGGGTQNLGTAPVPPPAPPPQTPQGAAAQQVLSGLPGMQAHPTGAPTVPLGPLSSPAQTPLAGGTAAQQQQLTTLFTQWLQQQVQQGQRNAAQNPPPGQPGAGPAPGGVAGAPTGPLSQPAGQAPATPNWNAAMLAAALQVGMLNTVLPYATGGTAPAQQSGSGATQQVPPAPAGHPGTTTPVSAMGHAFLASSIALAQQQEPESGVVSQIQGAGAGILSQVSGLAGAMGGIGVAVEALIGGVAALGAAAIGINALGASARQREQALLAGVGGAAAGGTTQGPTVGGVPETVAGLNAAIGTRGSGSLLQQIYQQGINYYAGTPGQVVQYAQALGGQGVGQGNLVQDLAEAFALARVGGVDTNAAVGLTSTFAVQGQQNPQQIDRIFQQMWLAAEKANIPMTKLVDNISQLEQATNGAARSVFDVAGAIATQKLVGVSTYQPTMFAPMQTAVGANAIATAGLLGVGLDQFVSAQGNQAKLFDLVAQSIQGKFSGGQRLANPNTTQLEMAAQVAQLSGVDLSGMSSENVLQLMRLFFNATPNQAQNLARQYASLKGTQSFAAQGAAVAQATTSEAQKKVSDLEYLLAQNATAASTAMDNLSKALSGPGEDIVKTLQAVVNGLKNLGSTLSGLTSSGAWKDLGTVITDINNFGNWLSSFTVSYGTLGQDFNDLTSGLNNLLSLLGLLPGGGAHGKPAPSGVPTPGGPGPTVYATPPGATTPVQIGNVQLPAHGDTAGWDRLVAAGVTPANSPQLFDVGSDSNAYIDYYQAQARLGLTQGEGVRVGGKGGATITPALAATYYHYGLQYGVNPLLLLGQGMDESGFRAGAVSSAGAMGIAQFMPQTILNLMKDPHSPIYGYRAYLTDPTDTAPGGPVYNRQHQQVGGVFNPFNPQQAIQLEAYYLSTLLAQHKGNTTAALSDYYGSSGIVPGTQETYAQLVEGYASEIQAVQLEVKGEVKVLNDITNALVGIGTITPQKHTIDLHRKPKGHHAPPHQHPKKRM